MKDRKSRETILETSLTVLVGIFLVLFMPEFLQLQLLPLKNPFILQGHEYENKFGWVKDAAVQLCSLFPFIYFLTQDQCQLKYLLQ